MNWCVVEHTMHREKKRPGGMSVILDNNWAKFLISLMAIAVYLDPQQEQKMQFQMFSTQLLVGRRLNDPSKRDKIWRIK